MNRAARSSIIACFLGLLSLLAVRPAAAANPNCGDPPDMLVVLDHSASMSELSGSQTKWAHATAALKHLFTNFDGSIRFGLMLFALYPNAGMCDPGKINVGVGANNQGALASTLGSAYPTGLTPIADTLKNANTYLAGVDPGKKKYVLLITDGSETCGGTPVPSVTQLASAGVKTYVVGFGSAVDANELNGLATAGGTSQPGATKYFQADNPAQLDAALQQIGNMVSCCGNGFLDPGETCDKAIPAGQPGSCALDCDDKNPCTTDGVTGNSCNVSCTHDPVLLPKNGDGCCPLFANSQSDSDCPKSCGNGVLDAGELCDPGIKGGPGACKTAADCNDGDPCTLDAVTGSACDVRCTHTPLKADLTQKDGCCPTAIDGIEDADCPLPPTCDPDRPEKCVDACKGVTCPDGQYCSGGTCKAWPTGPGQTGKVDAGAGNGDGGPGIAGGLGEGWMQQGCSCRVAAAQDGSALPLLVLALGVLGVLGVLCLLRRFSR